MLALYFESLGQIYGDKIQVKWIWPVIALISIIAVIGYAVYCTWSGGTFAGGIKFGVPTLIEVTFNCSR